MSVIGVQIRRHERFFPWFLLATLLPLLVMPFTNLEGNALQRLLLPAVTLLQVVLALRMMPSGLLCVGHFSLLPLGLTPIRWTGLRAPQV